MLRLFSLLCLFVFPLFAAERQKICLNMIVKNESQVIRRCLDSVKPYIDYWVIVDTGSTDGTQKIIKKHLKDIPGKLYERPWRNFGDNRTEAFELAKAKGDYILFIDADDTLEFEDGFQFPFLTADLYNMWRGIKGFTYHRPQLVCATLPWRFVGVTHEYLDCNQRFTSKVLEQVRYISGDGGAWSKDPKKFLKNAKLLLNGLEKEPNNSRYMFYIAESYYDAGKKGKALEWYQKRVQMGGWEEEVFWSLLRSSHILRDMGLPSDVVIASYTHAHHFRPHRAEPIYYLADVYTQEGNYRKAYECLKARELIPKPVAKDSLFNMDWVEEYGLLFQLSICSFYLGHYQEALDTCDKLLTIKDMPEMWRKQVEINRMFPLAMLESNAIKVMTKEKQ